MDNRNSEIKDGVENAEKAKDRLVELKQMKKDIIKETRRESAIIMEEAKEKNVKIVEIIPGKGSGQLKKRVLKFLERNRGLYHRLDKDSKNWGMLFVRFK